MTSHNGLCSCKKLHLVLLTWSQTNEREMHWSASKTINNGQCLQNRLSRTPHNIRCAVEIPAVSERRVLQLCKPERWFLATAANLLVLISFNLNFTKLIYTKSAKQTTCTGIWKSLTKISEWYNTNGYKRLKPEASGQACENILLSMTTCEKVSKNYSQLLQFSFQLLGKFSPF